MKLAELWARAPRRSLLEEGMARARAAVPTRDEVPEPLEQYQENPVGFATNVLGIPEHTLRWSLTPGYDTHVWDGTPDPIAAMVEALAAGESVGAESGTGTGKSFTLGWLILWFLASWSGARVFTFAPKEDQLRLFSWAELRKHWPAFRRVFPRAELTDLRIRMVPGSDVWGAWGYPVGVRAEESAGGGIATKAAGMHAEHMLLIYEETPGIPLPVLLAGEQTCTAPHNLRLAVGNPDHSQDALHQHCLDPNVRHIRISALDVPNVVKGEQIVPGLVSQESVERRKAKYTTENVLHWGSRVRGICPAQASDSLIREEWVLRAMERWKDLEVRERFAAMGLPALGVDVANSEDGDRGSLARGRGACCDEVVAFPCPSALRLGYRVVGEMRILGVDEMHCGIDSSGVGAATVDKCKELGRYVQALNGGSTVPPARMDQELFRDSGRPVREEEVYRNLRAQMHWRLRMDLQQDRIVLPPDQELLRDLTCVRWRSNLGKITVEEKLELKKRLGRSPDKGDAVVYWNWVRYRRMVDEPEPQLGAFAIEILSHEAREKRRVKERPVRPDTNPINLEVIP